MPATEAQKRDAKNYYDRHKERINNKARMKRRRNTPKMFFGGKPFATKADIFQYVNGVINLYSSGEELDGEDFHILKDIISMIHDSIQKIMIVWTHNKGNAILAITNRGWYVVDMRRCLIHTKSEIIDIQRRSQIENQLLIDRANEMVNEEAN